MNEYLPTLIAVIGSLVSGYVGVKVALVRSEERIQFINVRLDKVDQRMDKIDAKMSEMEGVNYRWRHDEYAPEVSHLWGDLLPLKTKVERLEKERG